MSNPLKLADHSKLFRKISPTYGVFSGALVSPSFPITDRLPN